MEEEYRYPRRFIGRAREAGSALVMAILFSSAMLLLLAGFFNLAMVELRNSTRSFMLDAGTNFGEGGVEIALDALNRNDNTGWTSGTDAGGTPYWARTLTGYNLGPGYSGSIKVVILNPASTTPSIFSEGVVVGSIGASVNRQIFVSLNRGIRPFGNGLNSEKAVDFSGAVIQIDSYNSSLGAYGIGNIESKATVSASSVNVDDATIHGYVLTDGASPTVGASGSITTISNPGVVDTTRIALDNYQNFPDVSAPAMTLPLMAMPSTGLLSAGEYQVASWSATGADLLVITGNVTIEITGDMTMDGNARIVLFPTARVEIYVGGDVDLSGLGILNATGRPERLLIVGTETVAGDQEIRLQGNGSLSAAIYAPNAEIELDAAGRFFGAVVGHEVDFDGDTHFSYDESLQNLRLDTNIYEVEEWAEYLPGSAAYLDMSGYGL